jgi:hypothetical protein
LACIGTVYCFAMFMIFHLEFSGEELKVKFTQNET